MLRGLPDGRYLAFASDRTGNNFDIYIWDTQKAIGAGNPRRLTATPADDHLPTWSPDGTQIAFDRSDVDIYTVNTLGTPVATFLTHGKAAEWSPWLDAAKTTSSIAFQRDVAGQGSDIFTIRPGSSEILLPIDGKAANDEFGPSWSPDGSKLVFNRRTIGGTNNNIYTVAPTGGTPTPLSPGGSGTADDGYASYPPDGAQIVFATSRDLGQSYNIYKMKNDGTGAQPLTHNTAEELKPDWQPI